MILGFKNLELSRPSLALATVCHALNASIIYTGTIKTTNPAASCVLYY
jgi:hypothetical protein